MSAPLTTVVTPLNSLWHQSLDVFYSRTLGGPARRLWAYVWARVRDRAVNNPLRMGLVLLLLLGGTVALGDAVYIKAKAGVAQVLLRGAWAASLADPVGAPIRPWPSADTWPVARLEVPRLGIDQIVLAGASGRTLAFGPAHLGMSPDPGAAGNAVISGHRDTHFRFLADLSTGDRLVVTKRDGSVVNYVVTDAVVAHVDAVDIELITPQRQMTLVTCYPFFAIDPGTPYRYVVTAEVIDAPTHTPAADPSFVADVRHSMSGAIEIHENNVNADRTNGQPAGGTQELESYGSPLDAIANVLDAGDLGDLQQMGGLPVRPALPRGQVPDGLTETFSNPREDVGLTQGRLVSQRDY